ncbi:MAG: hypothetical protein J3R72DRAFT_508600 [Linnemannia gamsii]|nr:MAG: hypothetical protein J3R72DRAFT_508600 [Linnemannia gamsii]
MYCLLPHKTSILFRLLVSIQEGILLSLVLNLSGAFASSKVTLSSVLQAPLLILQALSSCKDRHPFFLSCTDNYSFLSIPLANFISIADSRCIGLVPSPYEHTCIILSQRHRAWPEIAQNFGYDSIPIEPLLVRADIRFTNFAALDHVALDLLATHRAYIINTHHNIMRKQYQEIIKAERNAHEWKIPFNQPSKTELEAAQVTQLTRTLVKNVGDTFAKDKWIHIDGPPSDQKALAHKDRKKQMFKNLHALYSTMDVLSLLLGPYGLEIPGVESLDGLLIKVESKGGEVPTEDKLDVDADFIPDVDDNDDDDLDDGSDDEYDEDQLYKPTISTSNFFDPLAYNPPPATTAPLQPWHIRAFRRSTKEKVVKLLKKINDLWKNCHPVDAPLKALIAKAFRDANFSVCECEGEADLCIGQKDGRVGVFTSDSDHLFHGAAVVFRKDPKSPRIFNIFNVDTLRKKAGLSKQAWCLLALVTRNDYSINAPRYGFKRNLKTIKKLPGCKNSRVNASQLLDLYIAEVNKTKVVKNHVDRSRYKHAISIFIDHKETFVDSRSSNAVPVHDDVRIMFEQVNYYFYLWANPTLRVPHEEDFNDYIYGRIIIPSYAQLWHPPKGRSTRTLRPDPASLPPAAVPAAVPAAGAQSSSSSWILQEYEDEDINDYRYGWISNHSVMATWRNRQRFLYRTSPSLCALDVAATIAPDSVVSFPLTSAAVPAAGTQSLPSWLLGSYEDEDINDYRYGWISNHSAMATWKNRQRFLYRTSPALCALDVDTTLLLGPDVPARSQPTVAMHRHWAIPFRERSGWRPHHSLMSSNQFRPTIYTIPQEAGVPSGSPSAAFLFKRRKQQRAKERKKSREKTDEEIAKEEQKKAEDRIKKRRPLTSRAARDKAFRESQEDEPAEKGDAGRPDPTTIISNHLKTKYEVESLDYGTVHARLKDTVCASVTDSDIQKAIIKDIETVIYEMVWIASEAWRSASLAVFKFITKTMRANRGSTENSIKNRRQRLDNIGNKTGTWFYHVLFAFYNLDQSSQQYAATKDPSKDYNQIVRDHINTYKQAGRTHPVLNDLITGGLSGFLKGVGKNIEQAVQRHYMENIKVLVERVKAFSPTWALHAGRQVIVSINKSGVSSKYGNVAAFCLLNAQLPSDKRMKILPQMQFTDRFINIAETELLLALKHYKNVSQHTVKYLNLDKFRSDLSPYIAHPGDLYHRLFVSDSVGYSRSVSLLHPDISYRSSTKTPYLDLRQKDNRAYNTAREGVVTATEMGARVAGAKELYASRKKVLLDIVDPFFKDASINKTRLDKDTTGQLRERTYILKGSICTDGHQLYLLAFHTTRPYVWARQEPKTTKALLGDIREVLTEEDYQEVLVDERKFRLLSMDPGIKETITATVFDSRFPNRVKNITISQGSQLDPERKWKRSLKRAKKNFKHGDSEIGKLEQSIKSIEYPEADPSLENDENVWWALERSA